MSLLVIFPNAQAEQAEIIRHRASITQRLETIGVQFERWAANQPFAENVDQETILDAYSEPVEELKAKHGFRSADVISVGPDFPDKVALRQKFLSEHTHSDFEVRFFVGGHGLFYLHPDQHVYAVYCRQGDLISVPANTPHWFDTGAKPNLKAIRLFTTTEGWVAQYTGNPIAERLPKMEEFLTKYADTPS